MRSGDKILIVLLLIAAVVYLAYDYFKTREAQLVAVVIQNGEVVQEIPLTEDSVGEYTFEWNGHYNIVKITSSGAEILAADCLNQNCVHQGEIKAAGESIVCLPHRFVVEIRAAENEVDFIVK